MKILKRTKKGFTLVELIVVIAIVAILAAVSVVSYLAFINQANESADIQLVKQLNVALQADEALNGTRDTMKEMLEGMEAQGFVVENLTKTKSGYDIVWDQTNNRFGLLNGEKVIFAEEGFSAAKNINKWKFVDNVVEANTATNQKYSIYLTDEFGKVEVDTLNIKAGLDAGNIKIATVNYSNDDAQTVTIRTSSANTNLTISAEHDTVKHYDTVGKVDITKIDMNCYYEYGTAAYVKVVEGKVVAKDGGSIGVAFANNTDGTKVAVIEENGTVETGYTTNKPTSDNNLERDGGIYLQYSEDGKTPYTESDIESKGDEAIEEAKAPEIAEELEEETTAVVYNMTTGEYYENLYSAIESVQVNIKTTLVLLKNINGVSNKNYQINDNQIIVFDLNGHTMNTVAPDGNTAYAIENKGTLTIKDNSDTLKNGTGKGKLELNALNPDLQAIPGYASNLITNMGNLTVESGWLYNASTGTAAYAIDLNSNNGRNVSLIVNGGKITTNASLSIRQQVHKNTTNDVTINGGIIGSFWIQNYGDSSTSANGNLNINGGEFLYSLSFDTGYSIDDKYDIKADNVYVNINGGTFNGTITVDENGNNGHFIINGGTFNKKINYYGEAKFICGGTFNVSPVLQSDGYPYATVDGAGFGFYDLTELLNSVGTTLEEILSLDLETQIETYGFGLKYWESPSIVNKQYGGSDCYDVVRYVTPSYDEYIKDGFIAINNNDGTITVVAE